MRVGAWYGAHEFEADIPVLLQAVPVGMGWCGASSAQG
jgi:hypothetical protein